MRCCGAFQDEVNFQDWTTLTTYQQTSLILGDPPSSLPEKLHHIWLMSTLPAILDFVSQLETFLHTT